MEAISKSAPVYYAGIMLFLALILGGGTQQGLWTESLLQILLIPAIILGYSRMPRAEFDRPLLLLIWLLLGFLAFQFLPIPHDISEQTNSAYDLTTLISSTPGRTVNSVLYVLTVLGFFLFVSSMSARDQQRLLPFFFIGVVVNVAAAIIQLSFARRVAVDSLFPYEFTAGFFANENHMSSLVYMMIPLLAYFLLVRMRKEMVYLAIIPLLIVLQFAMDSRAGMAFVVILSIGCFFWYQLQSRLSLKVLVLLGLAGVVLTAIAYMTLAPQLTDSSGRGQLNAHTFDAIKDHWMFGTGLGSFAAIYQQYQPLNEITEKYINHAHNEYFEFLLEGGWFLGALIVLYLLCLIRHLNNNLLKQICVIGIGAILLHSIVDYPLRTMAIALVFAWYNAMLFSRENFEPGVELSPAIVQSSGRSRRSSRAPMIDPVTGQPVPRQSAQQPLQPPHAQPLHQPHQHPGQPHQHPGQPQYRPSPQPGQPQPGQPQQLGQPRQNPQDPPDYTDYTEID